MANRWGRTAVAALLAVATVDAHAEPVITSVYVSFNKATHLLAQNDGRCSLWVRGGELVFSQPREAVAKVKLDSSYPVRVDWLCLESSAAALAPPGRHQRRRHRG
jgi:hypothetical protein